MNAALLQSLQGHPERMNAETLYELRTLVARHPYFQEARMLLLTNLYLMHDASFGSELRRAAFHVSDRRALYRLVHDLQPSLLPEEDEGVTTKQPDVDRTLSLIDAFLGTLPDDFAAPKTDSKILIPDSPVSTDYMALLAAQEQPAPQPAPAPSAATPTPTAPSAIPAISTALLTAGMEAASPSACMETASLPSAGIETASPSATVPDGSPSGPSGDTPATTAAFWDTDWQALEAPMKAADDDRPALLPAHAADDDEADIEPKFFTETLAAIYVKQKKYERALEIIRSLYLKYPEKNIYFADQIRFLEKLIRNNNLKKSK